MKNLQPFLALLFLQLNIVSAQVWTWDTISPGMESDKKICKDHAGNLYLHTPHANGITPNDTITKITSSGQKLFQIILPANMVLESMACSGDSTFYLAGSFYGTISYGGFTVTSKHNDIWLTRHNSNGSVIWLKTIGGVGSEDLGEICMKGVDLVMTGRLEDSVVFLGQTIQKPLGKSMFVANISKNGTLQSIKHAVSGGSHFSLEPTSTGWECAVDPAGNIYLLNAAYGAVTLDNDTLSKWGQWSGSQPTSYNLIKLNNNLQVVFVKKVGQCGPMCYGLPRELIANSQGESFYVEDFAYTQSGNDTEWSKIHKLTANGSTVTSFQLRSDKQSRIEEVEIDGCDDLYFLGYWRDDIYAKPAPYRALAVGCLTSSLTIKALTHDSSATNFTKPKALVILGGSEVFVIGLFTDSLQLLNTLVATSNTSGFFAKHHFQFANPCALTVGLGEPEIQNKFSVYPNPANGVFYVKGSIATRYSVFNTQGRLVHKGITETGEINLQHLSNGVYYLRLDGPDSNRTQKIIVHR